MVDARYNHNFGGGDNFPEIISKLDSLTASLGKLIFVFINLLKSNTKSLLLLGDHHSPAWTVWTLTHFWKIYFRLIRIPSNKSRFLRNLDLF